jgi:hypothetical protein
MPLKNNSRKKSNKPKKALKNKSLELFKKGPSSLETWPKFLKKTKNKLLNASLLKWENQSLSPQKKFKKLHLSVSIFRKIMSL